MHPQHLRAVRGLVMLVATLIAGHRAQAQVTKLSDLSFGTILTGSTSAVAVTSGNAAEWKAHEGLSVSTSITFSLPTALTRTGGGGTIPLTFCSTCAVYHTNTNNPSGGTTFNPASGTNIAVSIASDIYIWLGASVSPPLNQKAGSYSASVTLTVASLL
ncbi:MAG TPA: hypothetical protein VNU46_05185 [Gemmatimonadaceae bacterium]|nr:hypothetical protein [Gemmatimonadaceae bacterium]